MATASGRTGKSPSDERAMSTTPAEPSRDLVIERVFDAPRELVWKAWTDAEHFKKWWGPKVFTAPVCVMDLRLGGAYVWGMRDPGGKDYFNAGMPADTRGAAGWNQSFDMLAASLVELS